MTNDYGLVIGGHPGLRVYRKDGIVTKVARKEDGQTLYNIAMRSLRAEAAGLRTMSGSGYTPDLLSRATSRIRETDVGDTTTVTSELLFRRACIRMLCAIRERGMRHGDLTDRNIVAVDNHPFAIDWQESHPIGGNVLQEHPLSDSALLFRCLSEWKDADGVVDPSRMSRRWYAVLKALGADTDITLPLSGRSFLDLGCFQGDFVAAAKAEGMDAEGVDHGGFRNGEDSIDIARSLWSDIGCRFTKQNIFSLPDDYFKRDVVMMFSTWAWMVQTHGGDEAKRVLRKIIGAAAVFLFETQLAGDGPGPNFLPDDNYTAGMLRDCGAKNLKSIGSFAVPGRVAMRTIWMVTR